MDRVQRRDLRIHCAEERAGEARPCFQNTFRHGSAAESLPRVGRELHRPCRRHVRDRAVGRQGPQAATVPRPPRYQATVLFLRWPAVCVRFGAQSNRNGARCERSPGRRDGAVRLPGLPLRAGSQDTLPKLFQTAASASAGLRSGKRQRDRPGTLLVRAGTRNASRYFGRPGCGGTSKPCRRVCPGPDDLRRTARFLPVRWRGLQHHRRFGIRPRRRRIDVFDRLRLRRKIRNAVRARGCETVRHETSRAHALAVGCGRPAAESQEMVRRAVRR